MNKPESNALVFIFFVTLFLASAQTEAVSEIDNHQAALTGSFESIPAGLEPVIARTLKDDLPSIYRPQKSLAGFQVKNPAQHMNFSFSPEGLQVRSTDESWEWRLQLTRWGRVGSMKTVPDAHPTAEDGLLSYQRGPDLTEWYLNTAWGLEQGFTIHRRHAASEDKPSELILEMALSGSLKPRLHDRCSLKTQEQALLLYDFNERAVVRYSGLFVIDADGSTLPAHLSLKDNHLFISVDDRSARYPITIDPWVQQAKLTADDGAAGDYFGRAIAISGDTLVVGAYGADSSMGAAYVFVKPISGWTATSTYDARLTAGDRAVNDYFGQKIAISGDTVVIGAHGDDIYSGSAYVFVKPATGWSGILTETAKLTLSGRAIYDYFGNAVSVSGNTVVVGAWGVDGSKYPDCGAAYVFVKPVSGWATTSTPNAKLTGSNTTEDDWFGISAAIDGDIVVVGAPRHDFGSNSNRGSVYVFVKPVGGWSGTLWESAELAATDGTLNDHLGIAVAISGDKIVAGANGYNNYSGAAYVFEEPAGGWSEALWESARLTASDAAADDYFGFAVAISEDYAVIGSYSDDFNIDITNIGSVYVYNTPATGWNGSMTETIKLTAADGELNDRFGSSVAVSGKLAFIGAYGDDGNKGSAYIFELDTTPPNAPFVYCPDCQGAFSGSSSPTWSWGSAGGGNGIFRFRRDNPDLSSQPETTDTSYTPAEVLSEGESVTHTLYVQERDAAGNWSQSGSFTVEIDTGNPCSAAASLDVVSDLSKTFTITYQYSDSYGNETCDVENQATGSGIEKVELFVKAPGSDIYALVDTDFESAVDGQFEYTADDEGAYYFYTQATDRAGNTETTPGGGYDTATLYAVEFSGYAILSVGSISGEEGLESHTLTANNVYRHLINRKFGLLGNMEDPLEHILYFNPYSEPQPGEDAFSDVGAASYETAMENAIKLWALEKMKLLPGPLYIILVDHGTPDQFNLTATQTITANELDVWLSVLEAELSLEGIDQPIVVILGTCYSGSFINNISKENRIIVASTADNEPSYRGPLDPLDPNGVRDGEFFISALFNEWAKNDSQGNAVSLHQAFTRAVEQVEALTFSGTANSPAPYFDTARQHPQLDDNGDFEGSHELLPGEDGDIAQTLALGHTTGSSTIVTITETGKDPETPLSAGVTQATLWARVSDLDQTDRVWVEIREPGLTIPEGFVQQTVDLTEVPLILNGERYQADCDNFIDAGTYTLYFYVKNLTGVISPFHKTYLYKTSNENQAPVSFSLLSPADGSETTSSAGLGATWQASVDPDGDSVTYTLQIYTSPGGVLFHKIEGIVDTAYVAGSETGFQDGQSYAWQVTAVDPYGLETDSDETRILVIDNTNPLAGWLKGLVYDAVTQAPIPSAEMSAAGVSIVMTGTGHYLGFGPAGPYTVNISATGYEPNSFLNVGIPEGVAANRNFGLMPAAAPLTAAITYPASSALIYQGQSIAFQGSASGGTAPYSYLWDFGGAAADSSEQNPGVIFNNQGDYLVTLTVTDADINSDTDTVSITVEDASSDVDGDGEPDVTDTDDDNDGLPDTEERGPGGDDPNYDGNADDTADSLQDHVASFHSFDYQHYVTLETPENISITGCAAVDNPSPSNTPPGITFPLGFFEFTLEGPENGFSTTVTLYFEDGPVFDTYYKFGRTPNNTTDHWYQFVYNGTTGAEINGSSITLHFKDGLPGDDDLSENKIVIDVGGPAKTAIDDGTDPDDSGGGGGGGCLIDVISGH